jgi:hypothetical protein
MAFRNKPRRDFSIIRNAAMRNATLSLKAKGLLAQMLTFPDDWEYHLSHLETLNTDGRDSLRAAMRELVDAGYVRRSQTRTTDGKVEGVTYEVTDEITADGKAGAGKPVAGKPGAGKPAAKNTYLTNTDNTNIKTIPKTENPSAVETREAHRLSAAPTIAQINELIEAWNANRGTLPAVKTIGEARKRKLKSVIKQHNGQAADLIRDATRQVSSNPFWQQNRYTLDNLLAGEKYLGHAEAFRNENEQRIARRNIDTEVPF